jgi:hypothetical protein
VLSFTNTASACFETPADGVPQLQFAHTFRSGTVLVQLQIRPLPNPSSDQCRIICLPMMSFIS